MIGGRGQPRVCLEIDETKPSRAAEEKLEEIAGQIDKSNSGKNEKKIDSKCIDNQEQGMKSSKGRVGSVE